jgi:glycosyltransferase involved in cell wall biosynthesis
MFSVIDSTAERAADVVLFDTVENAALSPHATKKGVVVPVGADMAWFEAADHDRPTTDRLRVVFFGLYTPLQGTMAIGEAIALLRHAAVEFTMIGDGQVRAACQGASGSSPAVTWRDWIDAADLPTLVAAHDVCLGIFGSGPKAYRVVPNKLYQAAAAGCAVVTMDSEPQRRVLGETGIYVPAGSGGAIADALLRLSDSPPAVENHRREVAKKAKQWMPEAAVVPLVDRLAQVESLG